MNKLTSYTIRDTAEGTRATYTYSTIDEEGKVTAQNKRGEVVLVDEDALAAAKALYDFLTGKLPEEA